MNVRDKRLLVLLTLSGLLLNGCSAPPAALDLIAVGREGLSGAQQADAQQHEQVMANYQAQIAALDAAFDADVRLVEAGGIKTLDGEAVVLSSQWIISARKGYSAARGAIADQMQSAQAVHLVRQDNLRAADEALDMAGELIIDHSLLGQRIRQAMANARKGLADGE